MPSHPSRWNFGAAGAAGALVGYIVARELGLGLSGPSRTQLDPEAGIIFLALVAYLLTRQVGRGANLSFGLHTGDLSAASVGAVLTAYLIAAKVGSGAYCDLTPPCRSPVCPTLKIVGPCGQSPGQWAAALGGGGVTAAVILGVRWMTARHGASCTLGCCSTTDHSER
ncbi:MAG: hypothetical protein DLM65_12455 [Candidatus Aeolococcus gillhamiae]|uniref:Uncharacterized protein n=1 Tax=Candidatus Aeolococcus gillhamiae TaxID=3127015 RepID=A0A2W5Z052_9BACT|nr:MAG: hypothetical protein DLM65_12455 [Candidatus Dormibacter sp. RRmetagenome_bin12]